METFHEKLIEIYHRLVKLCIVQAEKRWDTRFSSEEAIDLELEFEKVFADITRSEDEDEWCDTSGELQEIYEIKIEIKQKNWENINCELFVLPEFADPGRVHSVDWQRTASGRFVVVHFGLEKCSLKILIKISGVLLWTNWV